MTVQEIWNDALTNIESVMGELNFKTWILPLEPYTIDGDNFVLIAQSDFSKNYLANYKLLLKNAISDAAAKDLSPLFKLKNEIGEFDENGKYEVFNSNNYANSQLLDKYVFSNFVTGSSNQFARAAAEAVVDNPGTTYNPLFLYGESGIGKTHLMHAIGNAISRQYPDKKILYVQSETFTNEMISAIKTAKSKEFREKYRDNQISASWVDFNAIRRNALLALANSGDNRALPVLRKALNDTCLQVREIVEWGLRHKR